MAFYVGFPLIIFNIVCYYKLFQLQAKNTNY